MDCAEEDDLKAGVGETSLFMSLGLVVVSQEPLLGFDHLLIPS